MEYLNETVWATLGVSKIHGIGVIAIRDIPKGTAYTDYNMLEAAPKNAFMMDRKSIDGLLPEIRKVVLDQTYYSKSHESFLVPSPNDVQCLQCFMNHSDDANTDGKTTLRDIKKGEELTENYRDLYPDGLSDITIDNSGFL